MTDSDGYLIHHNGLRAQLSSTKETGACAAVPCHPASRSIRADLIEAFFLPTCKFHISLRCHFCGSLNTIPSRDWVFSNVSCASEQADICVSISRKYLSFMLD